MINCTKKNRRKGIVAPDGLFYFWLVEAVCLAVTFRFSNKFSFPIFYFF